MAFAVEAPNAIGYAPVCIAGLNDAWVELTDRNGIADCDMYDDDTLGTRWLPLAFAYCYKLGLAFNWSGTLTFFGRLITARGPMAV